MRLEIFTVMKILVVVFQVVKLHSDMVGYEHLRGPCCLHLHTHWRWRQHGLLWSSGL